MGTRVIIMPSRWQGRQGGKGAVVHGAAIEDIRAFPGTRPRHLLMTLLGDYWYQREEPIRGAALADLLAEFGVAERSTTAALTRMAAAGLLDAARDGPVAGYRISPRAAATIAEGGERIFAFGLRARSWDGTWTRVCLAEHLGRARTPLMRRLRWLGFGPLRGAWYAPGDRSGDAAAAAAELDVPPEGISTELARGGDAGPLAAWDLDALRARYAAFISRFAPARDRAPRMEQAEALLTRTAVIDIWRSFLSLDPELPAELLPRGWPLPEAAGVFRAVYDLLGPPATGQVRQVLARQDPAAARLAAFHTTDELAPGLA